MMELFAQTHSICLICQAQRGFLLFLTVNLGRWQLSAVTGAFYMTISSHSLFIIDHATSRTLSLNLKNDSCCMASFPLSHYFCNGR